MSNITDEKEMKRKIPRLLREICENVRTEASSEGDAARELSNFLHYAVR